MRLPIEQSFLDDHRDFDLRYRCTDCAHFDPPAGCGHGYPTEDHLPVPKLRDVVVFCKEFELA